MAVGSDTFATAIGYLISETRRNSYVKFAGHEDSALPCPVPCPVILQGRAKKNFRPALYQGRAGL